MVEVWISYAGWPLAGPPRHTQPEKDVQSLLDQLRITPPPQPPLHQCGFWHYISSSKNHWPICFVVKTFEVL
jgi:hypothetical protein